MSSTQDAIADRLSDVDFYVRRARRLVRACLLAALVLIGLNGINLVMALNPDRPLYFATGPGKPPEMLRRLLKPLPSDADALAAARLAVETYFTGDDAGLRSRQQQFLATFTSTALRDSYRARVWEVALEPLLTAHGGLVAKVAGEPILIGDGIDDGYYAWVIEVPLSLHAPEPAAAAAAGVAEAGGSKAAASDATATAAKPAAQAAGTRVAEWRMTLSLVQTLRLVDDQIEQRWGVARLVIPGIADDLPGGGEAGDGLEGAEAGLNPAGDLQ